MKKTLRMALLLRLSGWLLLIVVVSACKWNLDTRPFETCESPTAQISHQATLLAVTYSLSALTGTTDDVKWEFGDGQTSSSTASATVPHSYTASGTYTVKATLTNKCGDSYTATKSVTVSNVVIPIVTIQDPTTIIVTGATLPMTVTSNGNGVISRYGLCYSITNKLPVIETDLIADSKTNPAVGTVYPVSLTQLQPNTPYYVRAFAINSAGIAYSTSVKSFTTSAQPPIVTTVGTSGFDKNAAFVLFRLDNAGSPVATRYGVCYSSSTTDPKLPGAATMDVTNPVAGETISVNLKGLTLNTKYSYRSFAVYGNGEVSYGVVAQFTTLDVDLTTGLIASLMFDGNANDISNNGNNGTLKNGASFTTNRKGSDQAALLLDGIDDYVEIADNASLRPASLSISIWIKPTAAARGNRMQIFMKNRFSDGENEQYSAIVKEIPVGSSSTKPYTNFDIKQQSNCVQSQGWQDLEIADLVLVDTWQHLVFVYEGTTMKEYHNNVLILTKSTGTSQTFMDNCPGGTLKFGAQSQKFPNYFQGAMDDIRIYNIALSQDQVNALYSRQ